MTKLAVPIAVQTLEQALRDTARAAEFGADLVEFRIDAFEQAREELRELVERSDLPCIVTCRPAWEGGDFAGPDDDRVDLLEQAVLGQAGSRQPAYVDFELAAFQRLPAVRQRVEAIVDHPDQSQPVSTGLILSSHDFQQRPSDLLRRLADMAGAPSCRVIKLAWQARSLRDNLEAFEIIGQQLKPTIALCMGQFGLPSRVLARKFGALLTFAALDEASASAPGQPTVQQLKDLYRWDALTPRTQVFGVIGWPVAHSMSPSIHNAGFDHAGFDGVYLPMPIPPEYEHFKAPVASWLDFKALHFRGASVTIPHKANLLRFVKEQGGWIEPLAQQIGAANTLTVNDDGSLVASNTDYAAALDAVCHALQIERDELAGKRICVIGAGGVARAVVAGFTHHGAAVTIFNRTLEKAQALADEFDAQAMALDDLAAADADVFINCTPIGMHPDIDQTPLPVEAQPAWGPGTLVFDTIYNPVPTRLLREARVAGCLTVPGTEMFVRQAAAQFEGWTSQPAPVEVFDQILREQLGE